MSLIPGCCEGKCSGRIPTGAKFPIHANTPQTAVKGDHAIAFAVPSTTALAAAFSAR